MLHKKIFCSKFDLFWTTILFLYNTFVDFVSTFSSITFANFVSTPLYYLVNFGNLQVLASSFLFQNAQKAFINIYLEPLDAKLATIGLHS